MSFISELAYPEHSPLDATLFMKSTATLEEAYNTLISERTTLISNKLEPKSVDAVAVVDAFNKHQDTIKDIQSRLTECRSLLKDLETKFNNALRDGQYLNNLVGVHAEEKDSEEIKKAGEALIAWETNCQKVIKAIVEKTHKEIEDLEKEEARLHDNIASMRSMILLGVKLLISEEKAQKNLCPVCFDQEVNVVLAPCGHTVCQGCSQKIGPSCMSCRRQITNKMNIYYSV